MQRRRLVAPRRKLRPQMVMTNHHNLSSIRGSSLHRNKNLCPTKDLGESKNGAKVFHQSNLSTTDIPSRVKSESPPPLVRTAEKEVQTSPWVPPTPPRPEINESAAKEIANEMAGKVFSAMTDAEWCCHCDTRHLKSSEQSATHLKFGGFFRPSWAIIER